MSKANTESGSAPYEMFVTISREDAPRLYDDLMGLPKGRRRINRLRFLANQGLMVEMLSAVFEQRRAMPAVKGASPPSSPSSVLAFMRSMDVSLEEGGDE